MVLLLSLMDLRDRLGRAIMSGCSPKSFCGTRKAFQQRDLCMVQLKDMVQWAMSKMKKGKAAGLTGVVIEILVASGGTSIDVVTDLINQIISEGQMPGNWQISSIVNCFKGK